MHGQQGVFEPITKQREAVWRFRAEPLRLHVGRDNEASGPEVRGYGFDDFVYRVGRQAFAQRVVSLIASGGEHLLLGEIQLPGRRCLQQASSSGGGEGELNG